MQVLQPKALPSVPLGDDPIKDDVGKWYWPNTALKEPVREFQDSFAEIVKKHFCR